MVIDKCAWNAGRKNIEKENLDGNCEKCKHYKQIGVHWLCFASSDLGAHVTTWDVVALGLHAKTDKSRRCVTCEKHFSMKTIRCSECVETDDLKNFKLDKWVALWERNAGVKL